VVFVVSVIIFEQLTKTGGFVASEYMGAPQLPVVCFASEDGAGCNRLFGFTEERSLSLYAPQQIILADAGRKVTLSIIPFRTEITGVSYEVRSLEEERLVENGQAAQPQQQPDGSLLTSLQLGGMVEEDTDYVLVLLIDTPDRNGIRYYSRVRWDSAGNGEYQDALAFAREFHINTFDRQQGRYFQTFLETDAARASGSLSDVSIYSTSGEVMWSDMELTETVPPVFDFTAVSGSTYTLEGWFVVQEEAAENVPEHRYLCSEKFTVHRGTERFYLLDYRRTMQRLYNPVLDSIVSDQIQTGADADQIQILASEGRKAIAFTVNGALYSCIPESSTISFIFGYADAGTQDVRQLHQDHIIKIIDIDDDGNTTFLVSGYASRGSREGTVGLSVYYYNSTYRTIEEKIFLSYTGSAQTLCTQTRNTAYAVGGRTLFLLLDGRLIEVDMLEGEINAAQTGNAAEDIISSMGGRYMAWKEETEGSEDGTVVVLDLSDMSRHTMQAQEGETIRLIGFLQDDLVAGYARQTDIAPEQAAKSQPQDTASADTAPEVMYCVKILDRGLQPLENYESPGVYITSCEMQDQMVTLHLVRRIQEEDGSYRYEPAPDDQIISTAPSGTESALITETTDETGWTGASILAEGFDPGRMRYVRPKQVQVTERKERP